MNTKTAQENHTFRPSDLANPRYLGQALKSINTAADFMSRIKNIFILLGKLITGRYGECYWKTQQKQASTAQPERNMRMGNAHELLEKGKLLTQQNELENAAACFEKILIGDKGNENAHFELGKIRCMQKQNDAALYHLTQVTQGSVLYPDATSLLAPLLAHLSYPLLQTIKRHNGRGEFSAAMTALEKIAPLLPKTDKRLQNALLNEMEIAQNKTVLQSYLRNLTIVLTNQCNLDCVMCPQPKQPKAELSEKVLEDIAHFFPYIENIAWCGGEVFLHRRFIELIDQAARHGVKQTIFTNGLLLNETVVKKVIAENINLIVSIDGTSKELYEYIRVGGKYEELLKRLEIIQSRRKEITSNFKLILSSVVMRSNYKHMEQIYNFAAQHNFDGVQFQLMIGNKKKGENIFTDAYDHEIVSEILTRLPTIEEKCRQQGMSYYTNISHAILRRKDNPFMGDTNSEESKEKTANYCFAPWHTATINFNGEFIPNGYCNCSNVMGNLNNSTIEELWNGELLEQYRKDILSHSIKNRCAVYKIYGQQPLEVMN